jgi:hypothetical protein
MRIRFEPRAEICLFLVAIGCGEEHGFTTKTGAVGFPVISAAWNSACMGVMRQSAPYMLDNPASSLSDGICCPSDALVHQIAPKRAHRYYC